MFLVANDLQNLHVKRFKFQESLEEINLEGNRISQISAGVFTDLPRLKSVNLKQNLLRTVARNSLQIVGKFSVVIWANPETVRYIAEQS